ncbi:MAG: DUF6504 family protein [Anaerolineales bacterium]|nr:DUF6504 family protein [Anaerolineales bacterium]
MGFKSIRFIQEPVDALYTRPPMLEKKPGCPDGFIWQEQTFTISELLKEWHDYQRKGRMGRNMQPQHAARASTRGSWGVGQDYYRVKTTSGRIFELYYDRAPKSVDDRKGGWFLYKELAEDAASDAEN